MTPQSVNDKIPHNYLCRNMYAAEITTRGQITLPVKLRKELGLDPRDIVVLEVENGEVRLRKTKLSMIPFEKLAGSIKPKKGQSVEVAMEVSKKRWAEKTAKQHG